jgi:hypothetical protein
MALPILQIAKLLSELTVIAPAVAGGVEHIRRLVDAIRKGEGNTAKQLDAVKQAMELQSAFNKRVDDQLRIIEAVLENIQKSLKVLFFTSAGAAIVALVALLVAILK